MTNAFIIHGREVWLALESDILAMHPSDFSKDTTQRIFQKSAEVNSRILNYLKIGSGVVPELLLMY